MPLILYEKNPSRLEKKSYSAFPKKITTCLDNIQFDRKCSHLRLRFFKFSYNFCGDFWRTCNSRDNYMHFTGYVLRHGDPPHFLWGKNLQCRPRQNKVCCKYFFVAYIFFLHTLQIFPP